MVGATGAKDADGDRADGADDVRADAREEVMDLYFRRSDAERAAAVARKATRSIAEVVAEALRAWLRGRELRGN